MLPKPLLAFDTRGRRICPRYLTLNDDPWLSVLLEAYEAHCGKTRGELNAWLREPLPVPAPRRALLAARHILDRRVRSEVRSAVSPPRARLAAAEQMTQCKTRGAALAKAANQLKCSPPDLDASLLADLPGARILSAPEQPLCAAALRLEVNLSLVTGLLRRARGVRIFARSNTRQLVRQAQLRGLIVDLAPLARPPVSRQVGELRITGPLSLFRHTLVYGRALASLIPRLGWCRDFELVANCLLEERRGGAQAVFPGHDLVLRPGDPLPWCTEPSRYDSQLEKKFCRTMQRVAPDWEVRREPAPLRIDGRFSFPDFELIHRRDRNRRFLLEIAGYYTADYLHGKLKLLSVETAVPLLLCVDAARACCREILPVTHPRLLVFQRTLKVQDVLARLGIA